MEQAPDSETGLAFPGKVLATEDALYIADSGHHRIVETSHERRGAAGVRVVGGGGTGTGRPRKRGSRIRRGLAVVGDDLFVADTENHRIRRIELWVGRGVDGGGERGARGYPAPGSHPALTAELASPWDLAWHDGRLFIAMAGMHQVWVMDPADGEIGPYAGSGIENLQDGPLDTAQLAQPSGLAVHGDRLLVADSETSAIRTLPLDGRGDARTIAGVGLFDFGGRGTGRARRSGCSIRWGGGGGGRRRVYCRHVQQQDQGGGSGSAADYIVCRGYGARGRRTASWPRRDFTSRAGCR